MVSIGVLHSVKNGLAAGSNGRRSRAGSYRPCGCEAVGGSRDETALLPLCADPLELQRNDEVATLQEARSVREPLNLGREYERFDASLDVKRLPPEPRAPGILICNEALDLEIAHHIADPFGGLGLRTAQEDLRQWLAQDPVGVDRAIARNQLGAVPDAEHEPDIRLSSSCGDGTVLPVPVARFSA